MTLATTANKSFSIGDVKMTNESSTIRVHNNLDQPDTNSNPNPINLTQLLNSTQ